jgi:hypothetical protein
LTDDFFYPGSTSHSSFRDGRNDVSPIGVKEGSGETRFGKGKLSTPRNQGLVPSPATIKPFSNASSSP